MTRESIGEKVPVNAGEAKASLLQYLGGSESDLDPRALSFYFGTYDVPEEAIKDVEVQARVDRLLTEFAEPTEIGVSEYAIRQEKKIADLLTGLFKG